MSVPESAPNPPLTVPAAELREVGHLVVDLLVDHWRELETITPVRVGNPDELRERLAGPAPETGSAPSAVIEHLVAEVLPFVQHGDHPRFFARIPGPSNPLGAVADYLAAGLNVFVGSWTGGSGPAALELTVIDWLREIFGFPEGSEGAFVSGGSVATLNALATARAQLLDGDHAGAVVYFSDQTHSAVTRGLRTLGFGEEQARRLPTGSDLRLEPEVLRAAVAEDRRAGRRPF